MSKIQQNVTHTGVGFGGLLALLFIGLKLTNYINWSWLWVLSPLWIPISIALVILLSFLIVWLCVEFLK